MGRGGKVKRKERPGGHAPSTRLSMRWVPKSQSGRGDLYGYSEALQARTRQNADAQGAQTLTGVATCTGGGKGKSTPPLDPDRVFVCRKHPDLVDEKHNEGMALGPKWVHDEFVVVRHSQFAKTLPNSPTIQAILEPRGLITDPAPAMHWVIYTKEQVFMHRKVCEPGSESSTMHRKGCERGSGSSESSESADVSAADRECNLLSPVGFFPTAPPWPLHPSARRQGTDACDVWSANIDLPVQTKLDLHAERTNDKPIPRYQMIVDPNKFVHNGAWVPCEFDISANGSVKIVGGDRSHAHPQLAAEVATPVFRAALPMVAKLRRPMLLLDQRRLQVVFKAQRINVPPTRSDTADSEYVGLWHVDGDAEHVVAVIIYYYHVDTALEGGDMEFCGREPMDVIGFYDGEDNYTSLNAGTLSSALATTIPKCRVPVRKGTMLVFSNYQMVHRVLRMVNRCRDREASRDFVALFVIDPAAKPLLPARVHLAVPYLLSRTLRALRSTVGAMKAVPVQLILEFLGIVPSDREIVRARTEMLRQQLQPKGGFAINNRAAVYGTGNGCFTMIGWLDRMLETSGGVGVEHMVEENPSGFARFHGLNLAPINVGRGTSEVLSAAAHTEDLVERLDGSYTGDSVLE